MTDTNYVGSMVKILEKPIQKVFNDKISVTECRVQLPQTRNTTIVSLIFWGNLGRDIMNYYQVNDYIMIEGYLSSRFKAKINSTQTLKKIYITVLKTYYIKMS